MFDVYSMLFVVVGGHQLCFGSYTLFVFIPHVLVVLSLLVFFSFSGLESRALRHNHQTMPSHHTITPSRYKCTIEPQHETLEKHINTFPKNHIETLQALTKHHQRCNVITKPRHRNYQNYAIITRATSKKEGSFKQKNPTKPPNKHIIYEKKKNTHTAPLRNPPLRRSRGEPCLSPAE